MMLSLQSLRYEEVWTLIFALCLLCGLTDLWGSALRRRQKATSRISLNESGGPSSEGRVIQK